MDYLYHYTKLDTLELILKSKKLRFSSLLDVDDLCEGQAKDLKDVGKYVFVSCFTYDDEESIPIWSMYANNGNGIRIKMNLFPFKDLEQITTYSTFSYEYDKLDRYTILFLNEPYMVEYVSKNEMNKIFPKIVKEKDIDIGCIGITKVDNWKFQKEVRFKIVIFPMGKNDMQSLHFSMYKNNFNPDQRIEITDNEIIVDDKQKEFIRDLKPFSLMINNMKKAVDLPIKYYDMKLKDEVINNFEITLGYGVSKADKHRIQNIVREFNRRNNAHITIKNSELKIRSN